MVQKDMGKILTRARDLQDRNAAVKGGSLVRTEVGRCWMEARNGRGREERQRRDGARESREVTC